MIRVHVICEGSTEEDFVREILAAHLNKKEIYLLPSCIGKVGHKGGNVNLQRLETDVKNRLLGEKHCFCTSFKIRNSFSTPERKQDACATF